MQSSQVTQIIQSIEHTVMPLLIAELFAFAIVPLYDFKNYIHKKIHKPNKSHTIISKINIITKN